MTTAAVLDSDGRRGSRGPPRRAGHRAVRPARPGPGRCERNSPHRLGLRRQAQDARARRGGLRRRDLFARVEQVLGLPADTVKIGIMDEERRTTRQPRGVHPRRRGRASCSSTPASSTAPATRSTPRWRPARWCARPTCARQPWIQAYEDSQRRHRPGLRAPRSGPDRQGHVGGARPDGGHARRRRSAIPQAGANCAWVPSPTAATLHATHYHRVDVAARQAELAAGRPRATLDDLLTIPRGPTRRSGPTTRSPSRARQQRPGHPRLRRALGRPGRRLLEGARHPRRRA